VLVIGQAFEGVPWGLFIANSPAYASEIVPLAHGDTSDELVHRRYHRRRCHLRL
jgi:hypothetical protein